MKLTTLACVPLIRFYLLPYKNFGKCFMNIDLKIA
jgi:hypothetical protein